MTQEMHYPGYINQLLNKDYAYFEKIGNKNKILFREIFMMLSNHKYYNIIYIALNSLKRYVLVVYNGKNY
jgi:hypothetical protein